MSVRFQFWLVATRDLIIIIVVVVVADKEETLTLSELLQRPLYMMANGRVYSLIVSKLYFLVSAQFERDRQR